MSSPQPFCGFWHKGQILFSEPFSTSVSGILNNVQVLQISPCTHQSSPNFQPKWHTLSLCSLSLHPNPRHNQLPRRGPVSPYNVSPVICFPAVFPRHYCKLEHNSKNVWSKRQAYCVYSYIPGPKHSVLETMVILQTHEWPSLMYPSFMEPQYFTFGTVLLQPSPKAQPEKNFVTE